MDLKNKKLLREWKKVENANIFQSFEHFARFYYENGEKFCYRKYTNEAWSKENFLFGTYEELLEYYRTDTTITPLALQKIGKKFNSLTVIELFAENKSGKKIIYAKCKCDCGNTTVKVLRDVVKGDVSTCGDVLCKQKRKFSIPQAITQIAQATIDEFWDYERNKGVDPTQISNKSKELFWWRDKAGNSFQLAPWVYTQRDNHQSSFPELAIFYYICKYYPSAINRANYLTSSGKAIEIDIYIPTLNIGIEYDGAFWHKDKRIEDAHKNNVLNEDGVYLIRVRENGLPLLPGFNGITIRQKKHKANANGDLLKTINKIFAIVSSFAGVANHLVTEDEFEADLNSIYALIYSTPIENSIAETCLLRYWDYEKNGDLNPNCVSLTSNLPIHFICRIGKKFYISPKVFMNKILATQSKQYDCSNNFICEQSNCCPFENLSICSPKASCLFKTGYGLPHLKCIDRIRTIEQYEKDKVFHSYNSKNQLISMTSKPILKIVFENNSAFPFFTKSAGSFWIKHNRIKRFDESAFTNKANVIRSTILPGDKLQYTYCIPSTYKEKIYDGELILYHWLFKEEYMRGWRFYIFLIIDFDQYGNIIAQESKIVSDTEFSNELDFGNRMNIDLQAVIRRINKL